MIWEKENIFRIYNNDVGGKIMKIIQEGNVYRRASWFEEHEKGIIIGFCLFIGFLCFGMFYLMM